MPWPISQDYNEAIQMPASSLDDPELKAGEPVLNALGLPLPRSGNFADVYEFQGAGGDKWAVKCFTREVPGLQERYSQISKHLVQARLPFTVDFQYLPQGIRIRGQWYPIVKMRWVDGLLFNQFVRDSLEKRAYLEALEQIWLRMARRLRDAQIAHADLQHGNIILVPGRKAASLAVKLIDYDGMYVPALAGKNSGEVGHPAYQHPQRLREGTYDAEVDRFSLLSIFCSLRSLMLVGRNLWDRFDTGDNLLFREADFQKPEESVLLRGLWQINDAGLHDLVGHLALACRGTLAEVPVLDLLANGAVQPLTPEQEDNVNAILGPGARVQRGKETAAVPTESTSHEPAPEMDPFWAAMFAESDSRLQKRKAVRKPLWPWLAGAGALAALLVAVLLIILSGHKPSTEQSHNPSKPLVTKGEKPAIDDNKKSLKEKKTPAIKDKNDSSKEKAPGKVIQPPEDPPKAAALTPEQITDAEKMLRTMFAELYGRDDSASRHKLAVALSKHAQNADPAARFVCLRDACELAAMSVDSKLLFNTLRRMQNAFDVEMMPHREKALELVLANAKDVHQPMLIGLRLLDEAKRSDEFVTEKISELIRTAAKRAPKDPIVVTLLASLDNKEKLLRQTEAEYRKTKDYLPLTGTSDPKARIAVGRYVAFMKEDWPQGLPLLAAGKDEALAPLAEKDLKNPKDPLVQAELANSWREHAGGEESTLAKKHIRKRAVFWAHKAYPRLPLQQKAQVEDFLKHPYTGKSFLKPGLAGEFFQEAQLIRKRIDYQLDFKAGFSSGAQIHPRQLRVHWQGFLLISQTGEYRISLDCAGPVTLKVDSEEVLAGTRSDKQITAQRILAEGLHPVEIHYQNLAGEAKFSLAWELAGASNAEYPNILYYHLPKK